MEHSKDLWMVQRRVEQSVHQKVHWLEMQMDRSMGRCLEHQLVPWLEQLSVQL